MFAKSKLVITLIAVLVFLSLTAAAPQPAFAAVEGCKQTHTVVAGEYLVKIASIYGVSYRDIATLNQLKDANRIYPGQVLCVSTTQIINVPPSGQPPSSSVKMYATSVVEDKTVTLTGRLLQPETRYTVYLSNYNLEFGTKYLVGHVTTTKDGTFSKTFAIPKRLIDVGRVGAMVINSKGDSFSNWFINTTGSSFIGGIGSPSLSVSVDKVKKGESITVSVSNLPSNVWFRVYINSGAKETGGEFVGYIFAEKGGKVTKTFNLPASMLEKTNLNVRVEHFPVRMTALSTFLNK